MRSASNFWSYCFRMLTEYCLIFCGFYVSNRFMSIIACFYPKGEAYLGRFVVARLSPSKDGFCINLTPVDAYFSIYGR